MCKFMITRGLKKVQCKLQKNNEYCHIHIKLINIKKIPKINLKLDNLSRDVTNLHLSISKKNDKLNSLIKERYELKEIINQNIVTIAELQNKLNEANKMKEDYNNYQIIKKYEKIKQSYLNRNIDILNIKNDEFHKLRKNRNYIVHELPLHV